ncbi:sugar ABC transporter substrate-binding protein [Clostridium sp. YIM B02555]|uniref:ABC transporter substrate-binding protein n=1 Tax=Clostridium sp. YIM B02555 TaxID=2911968 RepID=UPI001EEE8C77|nr:sugar ABC transporter substrate-binding protein [Clostridium sp. YIM B02555]
MKMIKKLICLGIGLSLVAGLAGCGNSKSASSNTVRLFVSGDKSEGNAYSKMAEKYEKETGVKVEVTDIPYDDLKTKISKSVQANDSPDVVRTSQISPDWSDSLQDLTSIARSGNTMKSLNINDEKGTVKGLPTDVTAVGMFINTDLFDKAGVSYPTSKDNVWTWDQFLQSLKTVLDKSDAKYGMVMDASDHRLRAFTYQFGGKNFFVNDAKDSYTTDDNTKAALQKFVELNDNHIMPKSVWTTGEDPSAMFKSGRVAAYMSGSWQINDFSTNITNFKWKAVFMPYEKVRATNMGSNFMLAFKNGKNPEGGLKFLQWLYTKENYQQLCEYAGYIPAVEGLDIKHEKGQDAYKTFSEEIAEAAQPISSQQTQDEVTKTMTGYRGLSGALKKSMIKVINGEEKVDDAIKDTIQDYNEGYLKK